MGCGEMNQTIRTARECYEQKIFFHVLKVMASVVENNEIIECDIHKSIDVAIHE